MARRELQDLVGFEIGPKMQTIVMPGGAVYRRCEDDRWEPYDDEPAVDESREVP